MPTSKDRDIRIMNTTKWAQTNISVSNSPTELEIDTMRYTTADHIQVVYGVNRRTALDMARIVISRLLKGDVY